MTRGPVRSVLQREKEIGGGGCEKQNSAEEILKVYVWIRESGSSPIQQIGRSSKELPKMAEFSRRKAAGCGSFFKERTVSGKVTCFGGSRGLSGRSPHQCRPGHARWSGLRLRSRERLKLQLK